VDVWHAVIIICLLLAQLGSSPSVGVLHAHLHLPANLCWLCHGQMRRARQRRTALETSSINGTFSGANHVARAHLRSFVSQRWRGPLSRRASVRVRLRAEVEAGSCTSLKLSHRAADLVLALACPATRCLGRRTKCCTDAWQ
jgi:hypothetical protein